MGNNSLEKQLQHEIDTLVAKNADIFNVVMGISSSTGDFSWSGAAGVAYAESGAAMQTDTPISIASVTKMITAAATMLLEENGRLSLEDPLIKFLPEKLLAGLHVYQGKDYTNQLCIYHLISQTSGLPDYFEDRPPGGQSVIERLISGEDFSWDLEKVLEISRDDLTPKFPPEPKEQRKTGNRANYSDTNYQLLGAVLEAVTQKPLNQVFEELIFQPLRLNSTQLYGYGNLAGPGPSQPADIYYKDRPVKLKLAMKSFGPDGGIISNVSDSLQFLRAYMQGGLFKKPETLERMKSWRKIFFPIQYGLGLMRFKLPWYMSPFSPAPELIGHSGASGAFLYSCEDAGLYLAGTLNQLEKPNRPFQLMLKMIKQVSSQV